MVTAAVALLRAYVDRGQGLGMAPRQGHDPHTPESGSNAVNTCIITAATSTSTTIASASVGVNAKGNPKGSVPNGGTATQEQLALVFSVSLAVETLAHCALVQGPEAFRPRLAECLFPLVALAAGSSAVDTPSEGYSAQGQGLGPGPGQAAGPGLTGQAAGPGLGFGVVHPSVQLAARTTLARLAGYLQYHPHPTLQYHSHPSQTVPTDAPSATATATAAAAAAEVAFTPSSSSSSSSLTLSLTAALLRDNMDYLTGSPLLLFVTYKHY